MTLNCNGTLISLSSPKIMGILNITPDSFFDGGNFQVETKVLQQVEKMLSEGATFIDIGAYSTRPGAAEVTEQEELNRILPMVIAVLKNFPNALLSIDTFRSKVAQECVAHGAALINDVSAGTLDKKMIPAIAQLNVPYCMMHMRGTPKDMQQKTNYDNLLKEILYFFSKKIAEARSLGITDIIIDPGFGFSKTLEQNYTLIQQLDTFKLLDQPLLVGVSRKSMIYKLLGVTANEALNGTTALHMVCLEKGANILRVHDVAQAKECIQLHEQLNA